MSVQCNECSAAQRREAEQRADEQHGAMFARLASGGGGNLVDVGQLDRCEASTHPDRFNPLCRAVQARQAHVGSSQRGQLRGCAAIGPQDSLYRRSIMIAAASTPGGTGGSSRGGAPLAQTPVDSLPHLPSFASRLARTSSNVSIGVSSPAAAGARSGTSALPPSASQHGPQQQHTPLFGSARSGVVGTLSPGFASGGSGGGSGLRPRAVTALATPGSGGAVLDRRFGSSSARRLSAPTGYSESGMSGGCCWRCCSGPAADTAAASPIRLNSL